MENYWDSFDCEVKCEEYYNEIDVYSLDEEINEEAADSGNIYKE